MFTCHGKAMEHDKRGGQRGRGKVSGKRTSRLEGGSGQTTRGKQEADNTTKGLLSQWQKMVKLARAGAAYVDAVVHQLPLRREKEGRGPIVVKAGEQLTSNDDANTIFHHGAARQRHWGPR